MSSTTRFRSTPAGWLAGGIAVVAVVDAAAAAAVEQQQQQQQQQQQELVQAPGFSSFLSGSLAPEKTVAVVAVAFVAVPALPAAAAALARSAVGVACERLSGFAESRRPWYSCRGWDHGEAGYAVEHTLIPPLF